MLSRFRLRQWFKYFITRRVGCGKLCTYWRTLSYFYFPIQALFQDDFSFFRTIVFVSSSSSFYFVAYMICFFFTTPVVLLKNRLTQKQWFLCLFCLQLYTTFLMLKHFFLIWNIDVRDKICKYLCNDIFMVYF